MIYKNPKIQLLERYISNSPYLIYKSPLPSEFFEDLSEVEGHWEIFQGHISCLPKGSPKPSEYEMLGLNDALQLIWFLTKDCTATTNIMVRPSGCTTDRNLSVNMKLSGPHSGDMSSSRRWSQGSGQVPSRKLLGNDVTNNIKFFASTM